jgi:hypothetical protein
METRERVQLHECCVVPYRATAMGIEFCLVTPNSENRWEFPKAALDEDRAAPLVLLGEIAVANGLDGPTLEIEPLGDFSARRGNEARTMTGYLMEVTRSADDWPQKQSHKRLWCLPEEARVRIRRKPLRQFIDQALRRISAEQRALNGNGRSAPRPR